MVALLALCFFLSGTAALVYQTAWTRQFALVFGTSELAVATVLAAYMGGLALGAWAIERVLPRLQRPVLWYAALELGISVSALLLVPATLWSNNALLQAVFGGQSSPPSSEHLALSLFYLASAFVALVIPTALMGATLPLLARQTVQEDAQIGRRIGALYAANTAGAVAGALLTAFVLLPALGLTHTVWAAAMINIAVFVAAWLLVKSRQDAGTNNTPTGGRALPPARTPFTAAAGPAWVLPLMLCSGAVSFLHEVLWTRMLSHIVGSSIYAFGVMVGSFLAGIALGGAAGALLARSRLRAIDMLGAALLACAVWAGVAFWLIEHYMPRTAGLLANTYSNSLFGFVLLLPLTLSIGTTYPLAVRILARDAEDAAGASARVYAWNTVGGIIGALAGGFWLIPTLRYEGTVVLTVAASAALCALSLATLSTQRRVVAIVAVALALLTAALYRPGAPDRLLLTSPLNVSNQGTVLYYAVGRSASVVLMQQDGGLILRTNGLPEAMMDTPGMVPRFSGEYWLSPLAVVARPETRDMLVVGLGGGVVLEGVPPSVRNVDVIELEPRVVEANRATRAFRKRDPLLDPRVNIITNDARGALALTRKRYDAIVSQPSHPFTAGASHLYTREFMAQARDHLNPAGVFVQWMNVAFVDESLLRSLTATLIDVFGEVRIYRPDPSTLIFLASTSSFDIERRLVATAEPLRGAPRHYARYGINSSEDLVAALAVDEDGARRLAQGAPLITDDTNRIATSSVFEWNRGMSPDAMGRALAAYDPLQNPDSWLYRDFGNTLNFEYIARRMAFFRSLDGSLVDRVAHIMEALGDTPQARYIAVLLLQIRGDSAGASALTLESLAAFPGNEVLGYAQLQNELPSLVEGRSTADQQARLLRLPASASASIRGLALFAQGKFGELAALDPLLAEARWTDLWFMDSNRLRAEWRARIANENLRHRLGDEAIDLLDRAAVQQSSLALFATRVRAALTAQRPDVLLESLANVGLWIAAQPPAPGSAKRAEARASAGEMLQLLDQQSRLPGMNPARVTEVRARLQALQTQLQ